MALLVELGLLSPRVASIFGGPDRSLKEKAILIVHLFSLLASEWLCPLPFPAAAPGNDDDDEDDDGSDDTFFYFFL